MHSVQMVIQHIRVEWFLFSSSHLLQDEVKHEDETAEVHVVIITVEVQGAVAGSMTQVFERAAAQRAAEWTPEGAGEGAEGVVMPTATWIWHYTHLWEKRTSVCRLQYVLVWVFSSPAVTGR